MSEPSIAERPGLRERKKARTRAALQEAALRLFREKGYDETSIEEICEAVEVSPSTFFRYFPTKEDLVVTDEWDPLIYAAIRTQPRDVGPIQALRNAMRTVFADVTSEQFRMLHERMELMDSVPAVRAAFLDQSAQSMRVVEEMVAERAGRDPRDLRVRAFAGAVFGVMMAVYFHWAEVEDADMIKTLDQALEYLEAGLPL